LNFETNEFSKSMIPTINTSENSGHLKINFCIRRIEGDGSPNALNFPHFILMFALLGFAACYFTSPHSEKSFVNWMRTTKQFFTGDEYHFRLGIFLTSARLVSEHNRAHKSFTVALNKFSHLTPAEYKTMLGHRSMGDVTKTAGVKPRKVSADPPTSWDWRDSGIVNPIKDQAQCGSCWAFSVVQAQESQWALKNQNLPSLSEQNLVDCVDTCYGCLGGDEYIAYDYVIGHQNGLWMTEADYPYAAVDQSCQFNAAKGVDATKSYFRPTTSKNEQELLEGCYNSGVVSIAIDASSYWFAQYSGGIFDITGCSSTSLDHAVGLVGYGVESSTPYWIVRNSWGTDWGEAGYIRMVRNKANQCGVASDVIIPQV
jgi:cathepsin L